MENTLSGGEQLIRVFGAAKLTSIEKWEYELNPMLGIDQLKSTRGGNLGGYSGFERTDLLTNRQVNVGAHHSMEVEDWFSP